MKFFLNLIVTVFLLTISASAQVTPGELMGLGMPDVLASKVASIGNGSRVRASAGTEALPGYSFSTDTDTGMYSVAANIMGLSTGGAGTLTLSSTELKPVTTNVLSLGSSTLGFKNFNLTGVALVGAGTAAAPTYTFGSDTDTGIFSSSANALGVTTGGALKFTIGATGTLIGAGTADIGWTVQAAANQACNTTCVTPCVFGQETTSKAILACTDATADSCLCAGGS